MSSTCEAAVGAAIGAGASYADARLVVRRAQRVSAKNGRVEEVVDSETEGIGIRVRIGGAWGFACDRDTGDHSLRETARRACALARAADRRERCSLEELNPQRGVYRTAVEIDPFSVSLDDKVALCLAAEAALAHRGVTVRRAFLRVQRELRSFASSDGSAIEQEIVECGGGIDAIASDGQTTQERSYPSSQVGSFVQGGWEVIETLAFDRVAPAIGEQAASLLRAKPCPAAVTTVVLDAEQMMLQVHESVGHPTELDRVLGTEAAYAGTSFLAPSDLGSLRYGSELMNITADPTTPGGLGTFGWDDEGVPAAQAPIVRGGVLVGWLGSREFGHAGSMRADGWARMPLVRMTNLHLEPGEGTLDDLLADVDEGVYLETNRSWSIDDKRLNFQFGTQVGWEIKRGRRTRMLRDPTYTGITPTFWHSLDAVAGRGEEHMYGTPCGKGQPGQIGYVSHRAVPCRFRNIQVGVTK
jgi:TldD protein